MKSVDHAKQFFGRGNMPHGLIMAAEAPPASAQTSFTDSNGLFAFVFSDPALENDPAVAARVREAAYYLKGFSTLVTGKLFSDNADDVGKAFLIPPADVKEIATHLPLIGAFESEKITNSEESSAITFSTLFLKAALGLVTGAGDMELVKQTQDWLSSVGDQITISHDAKAQTYNVTIFGGLIDVVGTGAVVDIEPKFRIVGTSLSVAAVSNAIANCIKTQTFTLEFEADSFVAAVDINALADPETKADLDSLVGGGAVNQIDNSKNYFGVKKKPAS